MIDVNYKTEGEKLTLFIEGRIDSANAPEIEGKMRGILEEHPSEHAALSGRRACSCIWGRRMRRGSVKLRIKPR